MIVKDKDELRRDAQQYMDLANDHRVSHVYLRLALKAAAVDLLWFARAEPQAPKQAPAVVIPHKL